MSGYVKYFDDGGKPQPIYDDKYIKKQIHKN